MLSLDKKWAHCVDLPGEFVDAADGAGALALSPDGHKLYVMVTTTRALAVVDTGSLRVTRTTHVGGADETGTIAGRPHGTLAADGAGRLFAGIGSRLVTLDTATFRVSGGLQVGTTIMGVEPVRSHDWVSVATPYRFAVIDLASGRWLQETALPGATGLVRTDVAPLLPVPDRGGLSCAC